MSYKRRLAWMGLSQACFFGVQFAGSVIVARLLTPYDMGVYAIAMAITGVLSILQAFGLNGFIVREPELSAHITRSVFTINLLLSIALSGLIAGLGPLGGRVLHEDGVRRVMLVLAALPLLAALEFLPATQLERAANFKAIALVNTGRTVTTQIVTVGLAFGGFSFMSLAFGQVAGAIFSIIAYTLVGRRHASFRIGFREWRRVLGFGLNMLAISGVNAIAARLSEALLGRLIGLSALGLYSRASNLNNLVWDNIHLVIGRVVFVDLAAQKRSGASLRATYLTIVEVLTALLWPAFAGLAIVSGPFILLVYGQKWVAAAHPLTMLSIAAILLVAISMTWELFVVSGETAKQARLEIVRAGAGFIMFTTGCLFGLTAAAAGRIGEAAFCIWLYRPHLDRMTQTHTSDFVGIYARSAALTLLTVAPAAIVMALHGGSEHTPLTLLGPAIGLGGLMWMAALHRMRHPLAIEALRLASQRLSWIRPLR
jgi:O-antigen/teichoic acid export membrane protein